MPLNIAKYNLPPFLQEKLTTAIMDIVSDVKRVTDADDRAASLLVADYLLSVAKNVSEQISGAPDDTERLH